MREQTSPQIKPPTGGAAIPTLLAQWQDSGESRHIVAERVFPPIPGRFAEFPAWVSPSLRNALARFGVERLYRHQAEAAGLAHGGQDTVIATATASGKSLCYNLPVFQALLDDPAARALYLFPTKALSRDQVESARSLARSLDDKKSVGICVYDGDTPPDERRAARGRARIIATNPDMLHGGILPHHHRWRELFSGLRYVVLDEMHTYRGVFGSHVANVLRRLDRIARFYGARPVYIATSATIANPAELAQKLFGRTPKVVSKSDAPCGERHFAIYNPPVLDAALGVRESYLKAACRLTCDLVAHGMSTLVFCRSRLNVEVLVRYLRDSLPVPAAGGVVIPGNDPGNEQRVRGYRGGYLPERRRAVEAAMRDGMPEVVVATSALELGIDVGALDAVVLAGWPGSRAAVWQRAGRAGRRLDPSLTLLVASSAPVDQFVANGAEYLFDQGAEHARIEPDNPAICVPHLKCSAFELPFAGGDTIGELNPDETAEVLDTLAEAELLHKGAGPSYHYVGGQYPAGDISLRGHLDENFLVVDTEQSTVLAEVDYRDAPEYLHDHAIYQLEGRQYRVEHLDHDAHKAFVVPVDVDYYTTANTNLRLRVLETLEGDERDPCSHGEVHVLNRVVGFKKIKLHTHENIGYGEVQQPEREMHTTACWFRVLPQSMVKLNRSPGEIAEGTLALAQTLHSAAALLLMSDRGDLGRAVGDGRASHFQAVERVDGPTPFSPAENPLLDGRSVPTIFFYDRYPGGIGLAERLHDERQHLMGRASTMIERCACRRGCPACIGAGGRREAKGLALDLSRLLLEDIAASPQRLSRS